MLRTEIEVAAESHLGLVAKVHTSNCLDGHKCSPDGIANCGGGYIGGMIKRCAFVLVCIFQTVWVSVSGQCESTEVVFTSTTGQWGQEMAWELYHIADEDTSMVASFQGTMDGETVSDTLCLDDGCYTLLATDSWGDGWNGGTLSSDVVLGDFDSEFTLSDDFFGFLSFSVGGAECTFLISGCADPEALNYLEGATVDDGTCIYMETFGYIDNGLSINREYIYYAPEGMEPGAPLVFVLHGYNGLAQGMFNWSGFRELADAEGFGAVFPQGAPDSGGTNHWNANLNFSDVNDHAFLAQLAEYLQNTYGHEADCTYSCGYSNGGYMSYSLACDNAETFRGIGSVGGQMGGNDWSTCAPSQPVPVVHLHGTADNTVLYDGDPSDPGNWGGNPGVEAVVSQWAEWNNCTEVSETALPDLDPTDGSTVDLITHSGGDYGYEARVYRVNGGGHQWFGSWGNMDITSAAEMWSFWSQFCGTAISVSEVEDIQTELVRWNGTEFNARSNCRLRLFDATGRTVLDRPMKSGQTLPFSGCGQVYLMSARQSGGAFQQLKIWAE